MTRDQAEILNEARRAAVRRREAYEHCIRLGLVAAKIVTRSVFPAATGVLAIESDQGPFLWLDAVIDPTAETGRREITDIGGDFQDHMTEIGETIEDTEFRHLWLPIATAVSGGWILEFNRIPDEALGGAKK